MYYNIHSHRNQNNENEVSVFSLYSNKITTNDFFSIGIHPWYLNRLTIDDLEQHLSNPKCLAIGECGLDKIKNYFDIENQKQIFIKQLKLARKTQKPIILHVVKSTDELYKIISEYKDLTYIWHGFMGNKQSITQFSNFDMYFSIGELGVKSKKTINAIPEKRLLCETDESKLSIFEIYDKIASAKGISIDQLKKHIKDNFLNIFGE